ncbi:MAG: T9SS type A sorting domain-containing protein, partial [Pedobacter sp.]
EYADVEVSIDGVNWYMVGTGCLDFGVDISDASVYLPYVNWVRIKNNDTLTNTPDGFDIDAVIALHGDCNTALVGALAASESERPSGDFTVYPNPTKGDLNFNFSEVSLTGNVTLELFNINGQKVATIFQGDASTDSLNNIRYNASNLSNGMYITKLTTNEGVMTNKVMIAK